MNEQNRNPVIAENSGLPKPAPDYLVFCLSDTEIWSFPRAHLSRLDVDENHATLHLNFPFDVVTIKAGSVYHTRALGRGIMARTCSIFRASSSREAEIRFRGDAPPYILEEGRAIPQIVWVRGISRRSSDDLEIGPAKNTSATPI